MKRILWFCLTLGLLLSLLGCGKANDGIPFSGGSGTPEDPYRISTADDLWEMAALLNDKETYAAYKSASYQLTADIDLGGKTKWNPMGGEMTVFSGTFDGNGHTISGLYIDYRKPLTGTALQKVGLFGYVQDAVIQNLTIHNATIKSETNEAAAIAASVRDSQIRNCHTTDSVSVSGTFHAGGLFVQINEGSSIQGCTNAASVSVSEKVGYAGGIAARIGCPVSDCSNSGAITSAGDAGGIACTLTASAENCTNTGSVTTTERGSAGGICYSFSDGALNHRENDDMITLLNCTNSGTITSAGGDAGGIATSCRTGSVVNCENSGTVTGKVYAGGILGFFQQDVFGAPCKRFTVSGCRNLGTVESTDFSGYAGGIGGWFHCLGTELILENCESSGTVTARDAAGGIAGYIYMAEDIHIRSCVHSGSVSGVDIAAGIVGKIGPSNREGAVHRNVLIESCRNTGKVYAARRLYTYILSGGIVGDRRILEPQLPFDSFRIENCENTGTLEYQQDAYPFITHDLCPSDLVPEEY